MTTADVDLYVRVGSRFVRYAAAPAARPVPPIPTPVPVTDAAAAVDPERLPRVPVHAPRCPHGHFARWATRNCHRCLSTPR
ncbi:hypothetical protein [Blastococcus sp. CT_GayMR16]|uniref:hypothetical protein n=1 Tax=Blastococcus sp. CT_GayMR16 TaxID=2559607 RepID=UPI001073C8D5|nr:hypothetical protein [Blastococcus sp. CT_GayMR16]TFV83176.1 hypothetical protein E4P38_21200 [Blastococcus sp. CT_GayMR16]